MKTKTEVAQVLGVGLDMSAPASLRLAVIDPSAAHYPWTDELHCCRTPRAVMRRWESRFPPLCNDCPVVAVNSTRHPGLIHWLQERGVTVLAVSPQSLAFVLRDSDCDDIPPQYRLAFALAGHALLRTHPDQAINDAQLLLDEAAFSLHAARLAFDKIATALAATVPALHLPADEDYPF